MSGAYDNFGLSLPSTNLDQEQSPEDAQMAGYLIAQFQYLFGLRGTWAAHWTEIAQRIFPMDSWLFQNYSQLTQQGDKRTQELYDSTGALALQKFGAILDSLLTPRDTFWHNLRANDPIIMRDKACRLWFDQVNQILFQKRYEANANFTAQNQSVYKSLGAYGTGAMFIDDLAGKKGLRYKNVHLSQLYLRENHQGMVDQVCRYFMLTAHQAMSMFGESNPATIKAMVKKAPDAQFFFLHWAMPREDRDPERMDAKGMEYASYYVSMDGQRLVWPVNGLKDGGYRTFPYAVPRYEQATNEAYGRSVAMDCLPAIKTLNEQKKTMLKQGHRTVDPVLLAHDDGVVDGFNMQPGAINAGGVSKEGRLLIQPLPMGNVQAGKELMEDERDLINDSFLVKLFMVMTENPEMTATEVMERTREKGILLAPTVGRQQSEYLGPVIHRELDVLSRQGALPPMPPLLKSAKGEYKIVHDSPISRTQKAEWASGATRALEFFGQYASQTGDSSSLDVINMDVAGPEIADIFGTPAHWINDKQQVAAIKQKKAKMQAMQMAIQAAPGHAALQNAHTKGGGVLPAVAQQQAQQGGQPQGQGAPIPLMGQRAGRKRPGKGPLGQPPPCGAPTEA